MSQLSPFVYWGQTKHKISLRVELCEVEAPDIKIEEDGIHFSASGNGVGGFNNYGFTLNFYSSVAPKECHYKVTDRSVEIDLKKYSTDEIWPRLTSETAKLAWLKPDFDKFEYDGLSEDEDDNQSYNITQNIIDKRIKQDLDEVMDIKLPSLRQCYLALYNLFQWVGYTGIVIVILLRLARDGWSSVPGTYDAIGGHLMICQLLSCLEFLHPMIGVVKTSFLPPLAQVAGRNFILFMVIAQDKRVQVNSLVFFLFLIWSSVEVFRYPFYLLSCLGTENKYVTYLRYTVWIPLYPAGALCEALVLISSRQYYQETGTWSFDLPNKWNVSFSFPLFMALYLPLLVVGIVFMLKYMNVQRVNKLYKKKKMV